MSSLWLKSFVILVIALLIGASFCVCAALTYSPNLSVFELVEHAFSADKLLFKMVYDFLLVVGQAFVLLRILNHSRSFQFSRVIVLYDRPISTRYTDSEYFVFRLMNRGSSDLYNVRIKATLRVFSSDDRSIDHFTCQVVNEHIPVFKRFMPFRIHIRTGAVHIASQSDNSLVTAYLSPNSDLDAKDGKPVFSLQNVHTSDDHSFAFIIYVEGRAPKTNRAISSVYEYKFDDIRRGQFANIQFRCKRVWWPTPYVFFTKNDIRVNFDRILEA